MSINQQAQQTKVDIDFFSMLGKTLSWMFTAIFLMPIVNALFGALSGMVIGFAIGGWITGGAAQLGIVIDPSKLWQVGCFTAWICSYVRVSGMDRGNRQK